MMMLNGSNYYPMRSRLCLCWSSFLLSNFLVRVSPGPLVSQIIWGKWRARVQHFGHVLMATHRWEVHGVVQFRVVQRSHRGPLAHLLHLFEHILRRRGNRC